MRKPRASRNTAFVASDAQTRYDTREVHTKLVSIYKSFIEPRSRDIDERRHEFILNILLTGLTMATVLSVVVAFANMLIQRTSDEIQHLAPIVSFLLVISALLWWSRRGHYKAVAIILVTTIMTLATYLLVGWSFVLPSVMTMYILAIVLAGILFEARAALITSGAAIVLMSGIGLAQTKGLLSPHTEWLNHTLDTVDVAGNCIYFAVIGLVTWLANCEIDRALHRARGSEEALAKERDSLEVKVTKRTRELKAAQMLRVMELQRLSEYGRMGMSLLHDVANPLTVASLNIEQLQQKHEPEFVQQISNSVHYLERYVQAARKQLKAEGTISTFSVREEILQVSSILQNRARKAHVDLNFDCTPQLRLHGDPVKFNQLILNLLINSIEAYSTSGRIRKPVILICSAHSDGIQIEVTDKGSGIPVALREDIFEPFFTTKPNSTQNMGIGLSMVKRYVEQDFGGSITVRSNKRQGTCFTLHLYNQKDSHASRHTPPEPEIYSFSTSERR